VLKAGGSMTEHDANQYLAWTNTLTRLMRQMGLKAADEPGETIADYLAKRSGSAA
jgi:hypothetical protein